MSAVKTFQVGDRVMTHDAGDVVAFGSVIKRLKRGLRIAWDDGGSTTEFDFHLASAPKKSVPMRRVGWMLNYGQAFTSDQQTAEKWKVQGLGVRPIYERRDR